MNESQHKAHIDLAFDNATAAMFAEIITNDEFLEKVFLYIGKELNKQYKENNQMTGVTANEVVEHVIVDRLTRKSVGKTFTFEQTNTNINRKAAERCIDTLLCMSLLYEKPMKPYKFVLLTRRGQQVLVALQQLIKNKL
ncbi:MAG: hypothetical protein ACI35O_03245 [Bacillaceae bacterium]